MPLRIRNSYEHFVSFRGDVRDNDDGRSVKSLTYEVHPGAAAELATITNELAATGKINGIAIYHRSGELNIGDCALYVAVTAAHRKEAFELCSEAVNLVKERIPIWKHQFFTDGTDEWVNSA